MKPKYLASTHRQSRSSNPVLLSFRRGCLLSLGAISLFASHSVRAATVTWDGGSGGNANWDTAGNWSIAGTPANGDTIVFASAFTSGTAINLNGNRTINDLSITTTTDFSLNNNTLTITSGDITRSATTGTTTINSAITLGGAAAWNIAGSSAAGSLIVNGIVSGSVALTKSGTGNLTLSGTNLFNGGLSLTGGTLIFGNDSAAGSGTLTLTSGTVQGSGGTRTIANNLSIGGNITFSGSENLVFTDAFDQGADRIYTVNNTTEFSGAITGGDTLTKSGTGTLVLSGNNTIGAVTVNTGGALRVANNGALGTSGSGTTVNSGGALELIGGRVIGVKALSLSGTGVSTAGALRNISGDNSWAGTITLADVTGVHRINSDSGTLTIGGGITEAGNSDNKNLTFGGAGNVTVTGNITESSTGSSTDMLLSKDGAGTLTLSGTNTYEAGTFISGGKLTISNDNNLGATSGDLTISNGATLEAITNVVTLNSGRTITLGTNGAKFLGSSALYLGGAISGGTGITFDGELVLNRSSGDNAIGAIVVNSGRLHVQNTLTNINGSTVLVKNGASLNFQISQTSLSNAVTFESGAGLTNRVSGGGTLTLSNATLPTAGTMIFNSDDVSTNAIIVSAATALTGNLTVQVGGSTGTPGAVTLSGAIGGSGGLTKTSTGTLILGSANTYTGDTTVSTGILQLGNAGAIPSGAGKGNVTVNGTLSLQDLSISINGLSGSGTVQKDVTGTAQTLTVGNNNASSSFGGVITNTTGTLNLTKTGTGTQTFSGANTYTGKTSINGGTLQFAKKASLYNGTAGSWTAANITAASGATLALNVGGTNEFAVADVNTLLTNISVTSSATTGLQSGAKVGFDTTNATGGTFTQGNVIANSTGVNGGAIGVTKLGTGTLILDKTNTYTGITSINDGTLVVNGSTAAGSAVNVASIAKLFGTGTIGGATTILGTQSSGASAGAVGTQNFSSSLAYGNSSIFEWDLNANSTTNGFDKVSALGNITVGTSTVFNVVFGAGVNLANAFWSTPNTTQTWSMASIFGKSFTSGSFASVVSTANPTTQGSFTITGSTLTWTAVPEPTSALAGILLGAGLLRRKRSQRQSA